MSSDSSDSEHHTPETTTAETSTAENATAKNATEPSEAENAAPANAESSAEGETPQAEKIGPAKKKKLAAKARAEKKQAEKEQTEKEQAEKAQDSEDQSEESGDEPSFETLGLIPEVLRAVQQAGYEAPSGIQEAAIPPLLAGHDLLGQAQTGTGKTAAFTLPILSRIDLSRQEPQALILTPTRELAIQVAEAMQTYARGLKGFHVVPVYGGQNIQTQLRRLRRKVHVVVGTPGRIIDHLKRKTLGLGSLQTLVLDEADEMLRMGFIDEVGQILEQTPAEKQVALFSATMPGAIRKVAEKHLRDPVHVNIKAKTATVSTVTQRYWRVSGMHKLDALTRILETAEFDAMLIFARTKVATVELAEKLEARGFASSALNGDMNQALRERVVDRLRDGKLDIVIATDVAARGLDVERISHVVNYDIPYDVESYVHRIGRTARAGRRGEAILFVSTRERRMMLEIERVTRQKLEPLILPTREDVADRRVERFKQTILQALEVDRLDFFAGVVESFSQENDIEVERVAAALAYLAQKERPILPPPKRPQRDGYEERGGRPQRDRFDSDRPQRDRPQRDRPTRDHRPPRDRPSRQDRPAPERGPAPDIDGVKMVSYRIEVGHNHGVQPGNIVGAISNEAELDGRYIGRIDLRDDHSLVDLPDGMPWETFKHLKRVRVCGEELRIRLAEDDDRSMEKKHDRRFGKGTGGGRGGGRPGGGRPGGGGPKKKFSGKGKGKKRGFKK